MRFYKLITNASVKIFSRLSENLTVCGDEWVLLYLDEIQNFNKKQQSLLEFIENGKLLYNQAPPKILIFTFIMLS